MKNKIKRCALLVASSSILAAFPAQAANSFYNAGDLILTFQKEGGTNTVYANLGNAATLYRGAAAGSADGTNNINFLDLSTTLTSAFGAGWASDSAIYAGLAGVWGTSSSTSNNNLQDGDPNRTLYVSQSRDNVGTVGQATSSGYVVNTNTGMTSGSSGITQMALVFENNYDSLITVSPTAVSQIDEQNSFLAPGIQGVAYNIFASGVQQVGSAGTFGTFGEAGSVEFALDLYRIVGKTNAPGQVAGTLREGSYEGTVTVGTNGLVSFVAVPEPSSISLVGLAAGALILRRRRA